MPPVTEPEPIARLTPMQIGQTVPIWSEATAAPLGTLRIDQIELDPACDAEPSAGHFLAVHLTVTTTEALGDEAYPMFEAGDYFWTARNTEYPYGNSRECTMPDALPSSIGAAQTATGVVVLDVADPTGVLVFSPRSAGSFTISY